MRYGTCWSGNGPDNPQPEYNPRHLKKNQYRFPASIEYEYQTPEGSDVLTEIKKCVQYCKNALT